MPPFDSDRCYFILGVTLMPFACHACPRHGLRFLLGCVSKKKKNRLTYTFFGNYKQQAANDKLNILRMKSLLRLWNFIFMIDSVLCSYLWSNSSITKGVIINVETPTLFPDAKINPFNATLHPSIIRDCSCKSIDMEIVKLASPVSRIDYYIYCFISSIK